MIGIGSDHGGFELKQEILALLKENGFEYKDFGCYDESSIDYPDVAKPVAKAVLDGTIGKGILICGTGIGISITANKFKGIRCALCSDHFSAVATREHNDANILCFGERVVGKGVIEDMIEVFANTEFEGGRHAGRVAKIEAGCSFGANL